MIHLLTAFKVNPNASLLFYIGNIAPDAVVNWQEKEVKHLRNLQDRTAAMRNLAIHTDKSKDFDEGMLLHLFLDWKWDISVKKEFIKKTGENWFATYRYELGLASNFAFHYTEWSEKIWQQMDLCDISHYGIVDGATSSELKDFISRGNKWHNENNIGPSTAFLPDFIELFTDNIIQEYLNWRE